MLRKSLFLLLGFLFLVPAAPAKADWHSFWQRSHKDRLRNNCWPEPFQKADRESVCKTLSTQIAKGWKRQNTLASVYFHPETQELNEAGRRKLFTIVQSAPQEFQTIYVVSSMSPAAQERRLASVHEATSQLFGDNGAVQVQPVHLSPSSWSADYIYNIRQKQQSSMPQPILPEFQDTTSSGG